MRGIIINFKGRTFRKFTSMRQFGVYMNDILIKAVVIFLFMNIGMFEIVGISSNKLAKFVFIYVTAACLWGLLLIRFVISDKKVFGKTKFDIFYMGILTLALISVLLSSDRVHGVFGDYETWSYSIITFLSFSIIYYVVVLLFKYLQGIRWLNLSLVLSVLLPGIYYITVLFPENGTISLDYMRYVVLSVPFIIGVLFAFKKLFLKIVAFITLIISLFLVDYYSTYLQGTMFILSTGVLSLFILFYFSFWVKNSQVIINLVKDFISKLKGIKTIKDLKIIYKKRKREWLIFLVTILMAAWIIGFASFCYKYYVNNINPYIGEWLKDDLSNMSGFRMWLIGKNDLSEEFSSMEVINILGNYGILSTILFIGFLFYGAFIAGKMALKYLYKGTFSNVILLSSLFVTIVGIFITFLLIRFTPMIYLMLILVFSILAIIDALHKKEGLYKLPVFRKKLTLKQKLIKAAGILIIIGFTLVGIIGIFSGIDRGIFQ